MQPSFHERLKAQGVYVTGHPTGPENVRVGLFDVTGAHRTGIVETDHYPVEPWPLDARKLALLDGYVYTGRDPIPETPTPLRDALLLTALYCALGLSTLGVLSLILAVAGTAPGAPHWLVELSNFLFHLT